jgi:predicted acetyltransferase
MEIWNMGYKIERLTAKDYDELLHLLNTVFHKEEGNTFDVFLPVMWERTDERMSKHLAIRENGKIVAVVGVYPLPAKIYGEEIMFSTIGNVATLPEFEGRGMMKALMSQALLEAKRMGIDVARLGGARQRYNRYGFERAGVDYVFKLNRKNIIDYYGGKTVENEISYLGSQLSGGRGFSKKTRI